MKRREPNQTLVYDLFDRQKEVVYRVELKEGCPPEFLDICHPECIKIPIQKNELSKPEAYHTRVYNCFRLYHLTDQQRQEVFVISDHPQVTRLLQKLEQVHYEARENLEGKGIKAYVRDWAYGSKKKLLENFKIAWMSTPVIYVNPIWALKWLQETFKTSNFFFPFERSCKELENVIHWRQVASFQFKILQLQHLLAIYLRKSIVIRCENAKVPSELAKIRKLIDYTDKNSNYSYRTTELTFKMSLQDAFNCGYVKNQIIGKELQDKYFAYLEKQVLQLLEKAERPKSSKLSKRAKRNLKMKKAQEAKKKTLDMLHISEISAISINPEENHMTDSIVDLDAYKIKDHEEIAIIPASNSSETKSAPQMYIDYFIPPHQQQSNPNQKSANTSTSSNYYQEKNSYMNASNQPKKKQNRHGKRRYEEKKIFYEQKIEKSTNENASDAKKAALKVLEMFLENKLKKLEMESKESWELKSSSYNRLLEYFAVKIPCFSVDLFGSLASGVALPNSDIDILLTPFPGYQAHQAFLSQLAHDLSTMGWTTHCAAILTAKIPVIKLIIDPFVSFENPISQFRLYSHQLQMTMPFLIKFDITLNTNGTNNTGLLSTSYMQNTFTYQPKLQQSLLVLKHILEFSGLNQGYKGGVSSYNIFIMLLCYSEHKKIDLDLPLSEFLLGFFHFYANEFNAKTSVLRLQTGKSCVLSFQEYNLIANPENLGKSGAVKMIDPINGKLVRASFSRYEEVLNLFRQLAEAFKGVEEKARQVALSLMGRGKRNSWEIVSTVQAETATTEPAGRLASLLLIN